MELMNQLNYDDKVLKTRILISLKYSIRWLENIKLKNEYSWVMID